MIAADLDREPAHLARLQRFPRGALILRAGTPADAVHFIRTGQVRTYLLSEDGDETTTGILGPGQILGLSTLLGQPAHQSFAEAFVTTEVWTMHRDHLREQLSGNARLRTLVVSALSRRLASTEALLRDVAFSPVRERVRNVQARFAADLGEATPRLTRETLAGLVGARRETVSRALNPHRRAA